MNAPLYHNNQHPDSIEADAHRGLWFERFYNQYDANNDWKVIKPANKQTTQGNAYWLQTHFAGKKAGNPDQLSRYCTTQAQLSTTLSGTNSLYEADWHFVTGIGNPHAIENGFAWHASLGVPYLTGAAVKGIIRSYLENNLDDSQENLEKLLLNWFGSTSKNPNSQGYESQTGNLIFFDAIPTEPVTLGVDIMTPHMGKWYSDGGKDKSVGKPDAVPADWHDPIPLAFLSAHHITLQFSVALSPRAQKNSGIDLDDVSQVLTAALDNAGAGAKTSTGYGGFKRSTDAEDRARKEQDAAAEAKKAKNKLEARLSSLSSDLAKEFVTSAHNGDWETNKTAFTAPNIIEGWLDRLEGTPDSDAISALADLVNKHFKGLLADPEKVKGKKNISVYKPRQIKLAHRLNALLKNSS